MPVGTKVKECARCLGHGMIWVKQRRGVAPIDNASGYGPEWVCEVCPDCYGTGNRKASQSIRYPWRSK